MKRRDFLRNTLNATIGVALGGMIYPKSSLPGAINGKSLLDGMLIIDPHAHPDMNPEYWKGPSVGFRFMKELGIAASGYSAIGDFWQKSMGGGTFFLN